MNHFNSNAGLDASNMEEDPTYFFNAPKRKRPNENNDIIIECESNGFPKNGPGQASREGSAETNEYSILALPWAWEPTGRTVP